MEERAEKRLEIFKNLIKEMATSASDSDAQETVTKPVNVYTLTLKTLSCIS